MESRLLQFLNSGRGQSRNDRCPPELAVDHAQIDERSPGDLLEYARALAGSEAAIGEVIRFEKPTDDGTAISVPRGWLRFFEGPLVDGNTKPSLALFESFLQLYKYPQEVLNRLTSRHRDFLYREVLGFEPRAATPDRVHVVVELKKGAESVPLLPTHVFSAGKSSDGVERLYSPARKTIVSRARVRSLRSVTIAHGKREPVRAVPIADSADGVGGPPGETGAAWQPFAHPKRLPADIGFALSSPILRLQAGRRTIVVSLTIARLDPSTMPVSVSSGAFQAYLTADKRWLGPIPAILTFAAGRMEIRFEVPATDGAIVDYNAAVHGQSYATDAPVLQLLLKPGADLTYDDLSALTVDTAAVRVDVDGIRDLVLESDAGRLDPGKAFLPFGPEPVSGSRFVIRCDEALSKRPTRLTLSLTWKGCPSDFATHYAGYAAGVSNTSFRAMTTLPGSAPGAPAVFVPLFSPEGPTKPATLDLLADGPSRHFQEASSDYVYALARSATPWGRRTARNLTLRKPLAAPSLLQPPEQRPGCVILSLERGFLHPEYRQKLTQQIVDDEKGPVLNVPYSPTVQEISLSYSASTRTLLLSSTEADEFAKLDLQFFHIAPFGQMQEHAHLRAALSFLASTSVPLLPAFDDEGELLIGLDDAHPGESVSILFQVAPGSGDPDVIPTRPRWFVLCNNHWRRLDQSEVVLDATDGLLRSGTITFVLPTEATVGNSVLPGGLIWLKAAKSEQAEGSPALLGVVANAVEVRLRPVSGGFHDAHLATALPDGSITRLKTPIAQVRKVSQPYRSYGGQPEEDSDLLTVRAAERLRHRGRAVSAWDYERLVLGAFPSVHRVKCIPHSRPGSWSSPGHVLIVVIADERDRRSPDPLMPRLPVAEIAAIQRHLESRSSGPISLTVRNPTYQKVRVSCEVRFLPGCEFNFHSQQLRLALVRSLSPWAFDEAVPISFGGQVYRSVLLNIVEELAYVDYVTNFRMFTFTGDSGRSIDVDVATPSAPDVVLVSDSGHDIQEAR